MPEGAGRAGRDRSAATRSDRPDVAGGRPAVGKAKPAGTRGAVGNESTHAPGAVGRHDAPGIGVGKQTLVSATFGPVQLRDGAGGAPVPELTSGGDHQVHAAAARGVAGPAGTLPHAERIQRLFGRHDLGGIRAHVGGPAAEATQALGAEAFATGNHVAFEGAPSLHTAAHEAAHVIQQRGGVQLRGGVGATGDLYEQHADQVADAVVRGDSAEGLLDTYASGGAGGVRDATVQRQRRAEPGEGASTARSVAGGSSTGSVSAATPGSSSAAPNVPGQAGPITGGPEASTRVAEIDRLLSSLVITEEYRAQLIAERDLLVAQDGLTGGMCRLMPSQPVDVLSLSEGEYEALTGQPVADLPNGELPGLPAEALSPTMSGAPATVGVGSLLTPNMNWYYRVLASSDPKAASILGGANLTPRSPDPGFTFQPASSPADMTFRHTRPGGNVPQAGTDRISTGKNLDAFETVLANRGSGEMMRVDVDAARRLGTQFLEHGDVLAHLDEIGGDLNKQLAEARAAGRGKNHIAKLEGRLQALERARAYAKTFGEGQGINSIPSNAMSRVDGPTIPEAVASERALVRRINAFRYGGRVLLVVGIGMSIARVASAPQEKQVRTAAEEAGGWALSLGGAAAGAKGGAAVGAALGWETGPGAVAAVILGSLIGAAIGFFAGEKAVSGAFDLFDEKLDKAASRDYDHFKELNPDATPADYNRMQQQTDDFDTWGIP